MFEKLLSRIKHDTVDVVSKVQVRTENDVEAVEEQRRQSSNMRFLHTHVPSNAGGISGNR